MRRRRCSRARIIAGRSIWSAARTYRIVGACDDDCSNLDLELIDVSTGGVVASDMLQDDFPVVDFTPQANGRYIVRLLMQTCTVAPCFAGARVLTGKSGAGRREVGSRSNPYA